MNEHRTVEHDIRVTLDEHAPFAPPDHMIPAFESSARRSRRYPRWLALVKEPPMRTDTHLAVGSPMARVVAIAIATVLMAALVIGASFAGTQVFAKDGFIVDASGGGTHTSIAAAVADAEEGFEIFVRPGTYEESIELDKTIAIVGDGPVEDIVIATPAGGPTVPVTGSSEHDPYAIHITGGEPTVAGLTFRGQPSELIVSGGSPTLEGLVLDEVGWPFDGANLAYGGSSILLQGADTNAVVRDSEILRGGPIAMYGGAVATITGNRLVDGPHLFFPTSGPGTSVIGNEVIGTSMYGLNLHDASGTTVERNTFERNGQVAIRIGDGGDGRIVGNTIDGSAGTIQGISVDRGSGVEVTGNRVAGTDFGLSWGAPDGMIEGNDVSGNTAGILITGGSPVITGNTACDNTNSNFVVVGSADPDVGENDFCPEPNAG